MPVELDDAQPVGRDVGGGEIRRRLPARCCDLTRCDRPEMLAAGHGVRRARCRRGRGSGGGGGRGPGRPPGRGGGGGGGGRGGRRRGGGGGPGAGGGGGPGVD